MAYKVFVAGVLVGIEVLDKEHKDAYESTEGVALVAAESDEEVMR